MAKERKKDEDKSAEDKIKSPQPQYETGEKYQTSRRKRKIIMPIRKGTVSESAIRKAIRKIMANQPVSNGT